MRSFRKFIYLLCFFFAVPCTSGLYAQFFINGNAIQSNDSCYQLTAAVNGQVGSIWNPDKISLNESFDVVIEVFLGNKDMEGADGIVFGFQPVSTSIGVAGGGIGFAGVSPSLGIEIDTWQNGENFDPTYDHIAIIRNGNLNHNSVGNLAGPVQASATQINIEDNRWHDLRVSWDAIAKQLDIYFDCELRLSYTGDIVNTIFGGDPNVFWGFTSATGGRNNVHSVCFTYTTFLDQLEDIIMCPGGQVELSATGGISYNWTPDIGLSNPNIPNPLVSPPQSTTYTVEIFDECNRPFYNIVTVQIAGDSIFFDLGEDTSLCEGESLTVDATSTSAIYQWQDGSTTPTYTINQAGNYSVTVTKTDTFCIANDRIRVDYTALPDADLGPDISLCLGEDTLLVATATDVTGYLWENGSTADSIRVGKGGDYEVVVRNQCGEDTDIVNVFFEKCNDLYIPNVFSPNNDGVNDLLILLDGGDVTQIHLWRIFDRWGNQIYEATDSFPNDPTYSWDGTFRGEAAQQGTYTYFVDASFRDGRRFTFAGAVHLLR